MGVSGNSNSAKSFQSFTVSEDLLAKVVEAVKAGEKSAKSSGDIQSFEVFYKGFRQNIAIGRIYVVPPSVCSNKGDKKFPTALLYGCLVNTFGNAEEVGDMVEQRIGATEFDEYSQADFDTIKEKLFGVGGGKFASIVLFAPMWWNKREYIAFHYTEDQAKLSNNLRHQVFAAYYDPRLSSAFDAIMTNVNTTKVDVTDITPKIPFPFLSKNLLRQFPELQKQGSARKKLFLTRHTADEITQEVLDPQELDVFESLDQALGDAMMPGVKTVEEAGEESEGGYASPDAGNGGAPRLANAADPALDPKKFPKKPEEKEKKEAAGAEQDKWLVYLGGKQIDAVYHQSKADGGAPTTAEDVKRGLVEHDGYDAGIVVKKASLVWEDPESESGEDQTVIQHSCGHQSRVPREEGVLGRQEQEPCPACKNKKACAAHETPFTNVGPGTEAADQQISMVKGVKEHVELRAGEPPIGIAIDENGVPRSDAEQQKSARKAKNPASNQQDSSHPETLRVSPERLSSSYSAAYNGGFVDRYAMPPKEVRSYISERMGNNSEYAPHAMDDHRHQIEAGAFGETPFDRKAQEKWGSAKIEVNFTGKTAADKAEFIAEHIAHDFIAPEEAMSSKARQARGAREAKLDKMRGKQADVALDIDSIWADLTEEMGPAPVIDIPGEGGGEGKPKGDSRPRKSDIGGLPEALTSDKPEEEKEISDSDAKEQEKGLENAKTKNEEPGEEAWHADQKTADFVDEAIGDVGGDEIDETWLRAAEQAIEDGSEVIFDVAAEVGQIVDNVKHMSWFVEAVARELRDTHAEENANEEGRAQSEGIVDDLGDQIEDLEPPHKQADAVQKDVAEARSEVVSPDTVDTDIHQETKSVGEAAKIATIDFSKIKPNASSKSRKNADAVQPDVAEAKSQVESPDAVDKDIKQPTESVGEAAKTADDKQAAAGDEFPEAANFDFGEGDLADIVLTEDEDGAAN